VVTAGNNLHFVVLMVVTTEPTRKQRKAQRVARPACANANVHFLLTYELAMLLPPSE